MKAPQNELALCMGSACHPRGNGKNLENIRDFLRGEGLLGQVALVGHRCQNHCEEGPNVRVNGQLHHGVGPDTLPDFLAKIRKELGPRQP